ncbi:unnamed protein product [Linum trigynum]|uniref:Uncharacterized protein n=1 Tax=Linum trigynum TaxID=586398 RepID=A0AAV2FCZ9_9ROSI
MPSKDETRSDGEAKLSNRDETDLATVEGSSKRKTLEKECFAGGVQRREAESETRPDLHSSVCGLLGGSPYPRLGVTPPRKETTDYESQSAEKLAMRTEKLSVGKELRTTAGLGRPSCRRRNNAPPEKESKRKKVGGRVSSSATLGHPNQLLESLGRRSDRVAGPDWSHGLVGVSLGHVQLSRVERHCWAGQRWNNNSLELGQML